MAMLSISMRPPEWTGLEQAAEMLGTGMLVGLIVFSLVVGAGVTIGGFYLFAWLAALAGRFLDGVASAADARTALAWGSVPFIWALLYRIPAMLLWAPAYTAIRSSAGERGIRVEAETITYDAAAVPTAPLSQILILLALDVIVMGWAILITSRTLAEAHQLSSWKGLVTLILAFVLPIVAVAILVVAAIMTARTG